MTSWRDTTLGEAIDVKHGYAFKGQYFAKEGKLIVLTPGNFFETGGFKPKSGAEKYYVGPVPEGYLLRKGDVVVAMTEQAEGLLGSSATIPEDFLYLHNQRIGLLQITDPVRLDPRFCYHLLNTPSVRRQIRATATGSKVRHTAPERIRAVRVPLPNIETQRIVAGVLDAVDDAIANSRRRIQVLDEIGSAIYREWFVRFRFPGHESAKMSGSDFGPMPDGWKVRALVEIADITMGQSPPSQFYNAVGIGTPFHQGVTDYGTHFPIDRKFCTIEGRSAKTGDILVSVRAPVGRVNVALHDLVIGRGLAAVRSSTGHQTFLLRALRDTVFAVEDLMGGGTIFKAIGKSELEQVGVVMPPPAIADSAEQVFAQNLEMVKALTLQERCLADLRNFLLPVLLSGQVDVSDLDLDTVLEHTA